MSEEIHYKVLIKQPNGKLKKLVNRDILDSIPFFGIPQIGQTINIGERVWKVEGEREKAETINMKTYRVVDVPQTILLDRARATTFHNGYVWSDRCIILEPV